jgi:glycosyltransferase involved in cell wall biosynthesis
MEKLGGKDTVLFMSTYPPRECGIAKFTRHLQEAIDRKISSLVKTGIIALNHDGVNMYNYPKNVKYEINDSDLNDYIEVAEKINNSPNIKLINIQHEFGLFGGEWGDHLLLFLEIVKKPVIVNFHCVLPDPNEKLKRVVRETCKRAQEIVVMTPVAVKILKEMYGVEGKINVIPHGIPSTSFENQERAKKMFGLQDKTVLTTFGLVSQDKAYEQVIKALPEVVNKYPNLVYLIVGETHPNIRKEYGEEYRNGLIKLVHQLGLEKHVKFYNKYIADKEIIQYIKASDIYISTGMNPNQITSGTLAYAMGFGRPVIAVPFLHAKDIVTPERGLLAEFDNPESFTNAILKLLGDENLRKDMEKHAYHETRHTTWSNVAFHYCELFNKYLGIESEDAKTLPKINTSHLMRMTDNFGMIQFATQAMPHQVSGYTLDDNARALLVAAKHYEKFKEFKYLGLIRTYLNYVKYVQGKDGKLYNLVDENKKIDEESWSEDAQGRAIWALGYLVSCQNMPADFKREALDVLTRALNSSKNIQSPRAVAFIIQGLYFYDQVFHNKKTQKRISGFAEHLVSLYERTSRKDWKWFEEYLTYANSKLSEALFYAHLVTNNKKYLEVAEESLRFLIDETFKESIFVPIGQGGWYQKGGERMYYDQQPIEAAYMIESLIVAFKTTRREEYRMRAFQAFKWFTGENSLKQMVYNENTGGCYDGLGERTVNINQGAESTLSYLLARINMMDV